MNVMADLEARPARGYYSAQHMFGLTKKHRWFALCVVFPTLLAMLYFGAFASDQYVSESSFVIKAPGQRGMQLSTLANLFQSSTTSGAQDESDEVIGYVRSRSALRDLSQRLNVRDMFASPEADIFSRYPFPGKRDRYETLYKYYGSMVEISQDHETGLIKLRVKAFTAPDAFKLNGNLLGLSEELVNRLNERSQRQTVAEDERRVIEAQGRLKSVRAQLAIFRNSQNLLDPEKQAGAIIDIVSKLTIERATLQAQLDVMQRATPNNPSLAVIRSRMSAIDAAIGGQNGRVVGDDRAIASKLGRYETLTVEQQFATQMLTAASAALEQARGDAAKQHFYLQRIADPNQPDYASEPRRFKAIFTVFAASLCLYFIAWMLVVGILEHAPED